MQMMRIAKYVEEEFKDEDDDDKRCNGNKSGMIAWAKGNGLNYLKIENGQILKT